MKRDKSVACRDAGLMRRDAKAHECPVAQSKREDHSEGSPVTAIIIKATYMP